jgi:hypothetical protein
MLNTGLTKNGIRNTTHAVGGSFKSSLHGGRHAFAPLLFSYNSQLAGELGVVRERETWKAIVGRT